MPETPRARVGLAQIPVDNIRANPNQPRKHFDEQSLAELAASLREHGLLQPVLVMEGGGGQYVLIAGERRWRAARLAELATVPAVIREHLDEAVHLELALVENLQRRDLTPIEEARAFDQLRTRCGLSQAQIAEQVGLDRSTVANALRLLRLPPAVQEMVEEGRLSSGQARTLLAFASEDDRMAWAERAADGGATVRELERAAAERSTRRHTRRRPPPAADPNLREAEQRLSAGLGATVRIRQRRRGGEIVIRCTDEEELMRVWDRLLEATDGSRH
jgi:ParB family chromosome partitioning protein